MKKVLRIITSPRGEASVSIKLGNAIVDRILSKYPGSVVKERNLAKLASPYLESIHTAAFFVPSENQSPEQAAAAKYSDDAIQELQEADIIVIDSPMYSFTIPAVLKSYFDHITRPKVTFSYGENGPEGLLKNKKVYLAVSSGGIYTEGPRKPLDFNVPYAKTLLHFIGLTDVTVVRAEGLSMPGVQETALEKGIESIAIA